MTEAFSSGFVRSLDANRTIKDALAAAVGAARTRSRVSVTDLVNPMQAFHKWTRPEIRPSLDRLQVMMAGTGFHEVFGRIISTEEFLEQLLELDGITGKVDIYEDVPVEVKTTSSIPADIYKGRGSYFEQLGMYCAMAGNDTGRLFVYQRQTAEQAADLKVYETVFSNLEKVASEMRARRDLFQLALERNDPSGLPQCEWLYRGCDYSGICPCRSTSPAPPVVPRDEVAITERNELAEELKDKLSAAPPPESRFRLNDLVFPRKAALSRSHSGDETDGEADAASRMADMQRQGFQYALYSALRYGSPGQFRGVPVRLGSIDDRVNTYVDAPTILRTPGLREMVERNRLSSFFSHYFDRLAFECALVNIKKGRLVLYYPQIPGDKFMVYDVMFHSRHEILAEANRRLEKLESGAPHTELPPCPSWMARYCNFASDCRCGDGI